MLTSVGRHRVLLTEHERECFFQARRYQRRQLRDDLLREFPLLWVHRIRHLAWSDNPLRFTAQLMVLVLIFPVALIVQLARRLWLLLSFPFRYLATFLIPPTLRAPGEKNLVGIYNAFAHHMHLEGRHNIHCMDTWVRILYGAEAAQRHPMQAYVDKVDRQRQEQELPAGLADHLRSSISIAREQLSRDLGNYAE